MSTTDRSLRIHWVGDISLNEQLCSPQYHEAIKTRMAQLAQGAGPCDLRVGNWEAPLWGDGAVNEWKNPRLCTTPQAAQCLAPLALDVVFLGNNHVYDCREKGFANTTTFLRENGIRFLGAGTDAQAARQPLLLERRGLTLAFLNYVHRNTNPSIPQGAGVWVNYFEEQDALHTIGELSQDVDALCVYLHWGADEFVRLPSPAQRRFGRRAIEAGATVVVFDHAHCLGPHEVWRHGHILYGLGNFLFGRVPRDDWPAQAYRTAMASMVVARGSVEGVRLDYLCRSDYLPVRDVGRSRARSQERLNRCLQRSDIVYGMLHRCESVLQRTVVPALQFVRRSGGLLPALGRVRPRHIRMVLGTHAGCRRTA